MLRELGPIIQGDKSVLDHDLTHATSGLSLYPAFDTGWTAGTLVIAPERVEVTRLSGGTQAGWSIYFKGESGLRYYVTHLRSDRAAITSQVAEGGRLGVVGDARVFPGARVSHAHVGINVELLLGAGVQLKHNTNYTHGQPTVREQLRLAGEGEDEVQAWVAPFIEWYVTDRRSETKPSGVPSPVPSDVMALVGTVARIHRDMGPPKIYQTWRDWRLLEGGNPDTRPDGIPVPFPNLPLERWWEGANADLVFAKSYAKKTLGAELADTEADLRTALGDLALCKTSQDARVSELEARLAFVLGKVAEARDRLAAALA